MLETLTMSVARTVGRFRPTEKYRRAIVPIARRYPQRAGASALLA
jgi:hypothetical protein